MWEEKMIEHKIKIDHCVKVMRLLKTFTPKQIKKRLCPPKNEDVIMPELNTLLCKTKCGGSEIWHKKDCMRIKKIFKKRGYNIDLINVGDLWERYSSEMRSAHWMDIDYVSDNEIFKTLKDYYNLNKE